MHSGTEETSRGIQIKYDYLQVTVVGGMLGSQVLFDLNLCPCLSQGWNLEFRSVLRTDVGNLNQAGEILSMLYIVIYMNVFSVMMINAKTFEASNIKVSPPPVPLRCSGIWSACVP